jgi:hypothetical protein
VRSAAAHWSGEGTAGCDDEVMPRHWVGAIVVVLAVTAGVTAYAVSSSGGDGGTAVTTPAATEPPTGTGGSTVTSTTAEPAETTAAVTTTADAAQTTADAPATTEGCPPSEGAGPPFDGGLGADMLLLTGVEITSPQRCTDEVVFRFRSATASAPGISVSYQEPPFFEDGSGQPVSVAGRAFLVVRFEPATTFDFVAGEVTYDGPQQIVPTGTAHVREARMTGAFEGVVSWLIGLDAARPFTVTAGPDIAAITVA